MKITHAMIDLTAEQTEALVTALNMRINYIETGDVTLNRNDAIARNAGVIVKQGAHKIHDPSTTAQLIRVKSLDSDQLKLVQMMTELRDDLQNRFRP